VKPVILLVDDEVDLIEVLTEAISLSLPEYRAIGSTSVEEAERVLLQLVQEGSTPALVCVDHKLGERTGLEFIEDLHERFPALPSILLTGQAPPGVEDRAHALGARVLWKPIGLSKWLGEVRGLLP